MSACRLEARLLSGRLCEEERTEEEDEEEDAERNEIERPEVGRFGSPGSLARCVAAAMIDCTYWLSGIDGNDTPDALSFLL
jgi:hypothetical protein